MNENEELIEKLKIAIIYGKKKVDGICKDGEVEKIYKDEEDTAHFFYMKEFLQTHFKDEEELKEVLQTRNDVNSIFYEIQKLGHIVFAESTSIPKHKEGVVYMPKDISDKQKGTLKTFQKQLEKENYNIIELINLHRSEDGVLLGNQKMGKANLLSEFTKDDEELEL